ncbi:MAG: aminoacyl-tRNA hydrolase [Gemmatales bacterium]|nr:aminoacyl-tRNA hydrolase [Gemmatales bacterium]MDW7995444.1 aminoacyl-tRNA hydrolase [Gemmatales bacterium]
MKLVVGLGNPEPRYQGTRHNVGFDVVDRLASQLAPGQAWQRDFYSLLIKAVADSQALLLVKPQTYMNRSGMAVAALVQFYQVPFSDLLVICDDLNLPLGQLRLRARGSCGGHKGLLDVERQLGTTDYPRLRIGIGSPPLGQGAADYVLQRFHPEEQPVIEEAVQRAAQAVFVWATQGIEAAMNRFNVRQSAALPDEKRLAPEPENNARQ